MRILAILAAPLCLFAAPSWAQTHPPGHEAHQQQPAEPQPAHPRGHEGHQSQPAEPQTEPDEAAPIEMMWPTEPAIGNEPPPRAPADFAADRAFDPAAMRAAREQLGREHGGAIASKVMANLLEYQIDDDAGGYRWDAEAWIGGDIHRLVVKSEGEGEESGLESGEVQVLYSRAIGPYFDAQAGVRYDLEPSPNRTYATLGVEGVAPYWFEVDGALFLSDRGELLGRVEGSYDLRLTQRLILQPRAELNLSAEDIPELGVGSGLSDAELGLRLRYETRREFAPYVGVSFDQKYGDSADFARAAGEDASESRLVVGLRAWF